jgi:hypothetical protein
MLILPAAQPIPQDLLGGYHLLAQFFGSLLGLVVALSLCYNLFP